MTDQLISILIVGGGTFVFALAFAVAERLLRKKKDHSPSAPAV
jgi:hypothetical protein